MNKIYLLSLVACTTLISAKPIDFNFKDPKGINNIIFQMDAPLESINGSGDAVSGQVTFDPSKPESTKGIIYLE